MQNKLYNEPIEFTALIPIFLFAFTDLLTTFFNSLERICLREDSKTLRIVTFKPVVSASFCIIPLMFILLFINDNTSLLKMLN